MAAELQAFMLDAGVGRGQRLCVHHAPPRDVTPHGAFVYLHPLAEEMNKSRRMAALQSRALAAAGHAVLQIDLLGCGDSSGDFGDASWSDWIDDVLLAVRWMGENHPGVPLWLWGLRAGSLLAAEAARRIEAPLNFLFWQPTPSGKTLLAQFLRLKTAAGLLDETASESGREVRAAMAAGQTVEIAGYRLAPALADGLEKARLAPPPQAGFGLWFETRTREDGELTPATRNALAPWQAAHRRLEASAVNGPAFWQTQEIEDAPALVAATLDGLKRVGAA